MESSANHSRWSMGKMSGFWDRMLEKVAGSGEEPRVLSFLLCLACYLYINLTPCDLYSDVFLYT